MLTAITYNCNPESLGDVTEEAFAEAFENEVRCRPSYGELSVSVTFSSGKSEVTEFSSDDFDADVDLENTFREQFDRMAEKAFASCL